MAATNEVIEAAKAVAVKKGADAVTKAGTKSAQRVAVPGRQRPATTTQMTSMVGTAQTMRPQRHPLSCRPRLPLRDRACLISLVREGGNYVHRRCFLPVASSTTG